MELTAEYILTLPKETQEQITKDVSKYFSLEDYNEYKKMFADDFENYGFSTGSNIQVVNDFLIFARIDPDFKNTVFDVFEFGKVHFLTNSKAGKEKLKEHILNQKQKRQSEIETLDKILKELTA